MKTARPHWSEIRRAVIRNGLGRLTRKPLQNPSQIEILVGNQFWYSLLVAGILPLGIAIVSAFSSRPEGTAVKILVWVVVFCLMSLIGDVMAYLFALGELTRKSHWNFSRFFLLYFPLAALLSLLLLHLGNGSPSMETLASSLWAFYGVGFIGVVVVALKRRLTGSEPH